MPKERRNTDRERFAGPAVGSFLITVNNVDHGVKGVVDASAAGIGLKVGEFLDPGRSVRVRLDAPDGRVSTTGTVTWCEKDTGGGYRVGIVFDYPHQPESNRLFLATKAVLETKK